MPTPPAPISPQNIDAEIQYIIDNWYQNNSQLVTGQIGLNVVWNLATFIKQNPENWNRASVVTDANVNYVTEASECIVIFTNNSEGEIDYVTNPNIWNKYYIVNQTDNVRDISNGQFYLDINGNQQTSIAARTTVVIAKGDDDFWYQINGARTPMPNPIEFEVNDSDTPIISGGTSLIIPQFVGYNVTFNRNNLPQTQLNSQPTYFRWNKVTCLFQCFPAAVKTDLFSINPV